MKQGHIFEKALTLAQTKFDMSIHYLKKFVFFLDVHEILRVGGRFDYKEDFLDEKRHPAFLPKQHRVICT